MATAVLTRDPSDVHAYASVLVPLGLDVVAMPVTRTASAPDPAALVRALEAGNYAAVIVASARAAHELVHAGATLPTEVWAVGAATQRALGDVPSHVPPDVRDGAELARALVAAKPVRGQRVLVPRAEDGRTDAIEILRAAGAIVVDVVAYRTVAVPPDDAAVAAGAAVLASGGAAICAVFAPSQVSALAPIMAARGLALASVQTAFCAIGETTAAALRAVGIGDVAVAATPTPEGIALAVRSVYPPRT